MRRKPQLFLYFAFIVFAFISRDPESLKKWTFLTFIIYGLPFLFFLLKWKKSEFISAWFAFFCVMQTFVSALFLNDYSTLIPHTRNHFTVTNPEESGISGTQLVTTDQKGFRSLNPVDYTRKSKLRVIAIGGSTTEQIYIDDGKTWTSLLEIALKERLGKDVEVINTGLSGLTLIDHYYTLRRIEYLKPDIVLILFGINDWNRQILRNFDSSLSKKTAGQWSFRKTMIGRLVRSLALEPDYILNRFRKKDKPKESGQAIGETLIRFEKKVEKTLSFRPTEVSEEFRDAFELVSERCRKADYKCVLLNQPHVYGHMDSPKLPKNLWMNPPFTNYNINDKDLNALANLYNNYTVTQAKSKTVPACDLASKITANDVDIFYDDCHYNLKGARWMSAEIFKCIFENKVL